MTSIRHPRITPSSTAPSPATTSPTSKPSASASSNAPKSTSHPQTEKTYSPTSSKKPGSSAPPTDQAPPASPPTPATAYPNASSTGNANDTQTTATPATATSPSNPWVYDLTTLSPRLLGIVTEIEMPISWYGYSEREVATTLGVQTSVVRRCRNELRNAIDTEQTRRGGGSNTQRIF